MAGERIESFSDFWPFYLSQHRKPGTRALHMGGSGLALLVAASAIARRRPARLLCALAAGYGLAWIGHFFIEKNRPATFEYPLWSFLGDWKMLGLACTGRLRSEIERVEPSKTPSKSPPPSGGSSPQSSGFSCPSF